MQNQTNESVTNCCLIEPHLLFITAACAGSVILILLTSVMVLSVKLIILKKERYRRSARGSINKVSGSGHWSHEMMEKGLIGPCETNLLLEEVRNEAEDDGMNEEEKATLHQSTNTNMDGEDVPATMSISTSKDSCIDPVKDLEDMPLVVWAWVATTSTSVLNSTSNF